jgi:hypothetical protein
MTSTLKPEPNGEHPIVAWAGILAVAVAIVLILWARYEVHGTQDLEDALSQDAAPGSAAKLEPSPAGDKASHETKVEAAVAAGRWATGFSP